MAYGIRLLFLVFGALSFTLVADASEKQHFDTVIVGGSVYDGTLNAPAATAVGIRGDRIAFMGDLEAIHWTADNTIDATDHWVVPGFIDPHTHALQDLLHDERRQNVNYLTQGVTTVLVGNDGGGSPHIQDLQERLVAGGIGTNVGFFVGHGKVRFEVMGLSRRAPTPKEIESMKGLVEKGMREGALGLSTGLYYTPGNFAATDEVVELTRVIAPFGGIYETHLRDESSYELGFLAALREAIDIGRRAGVPAHIGHIKALGVDVWGTSGAAIKMINAARAEGLAVTADQYPWTASGTHMRNAVMPRWALADSEERYQARLRDDKLRANLLAAVKDNIRRRGGADALLIATCSDERFVAKTLAQASAILELDPPEAAIEILRSGPSRVISFNMSDDDIENFMEQPWVMTSSDGNERHPRKYASFPKKYNTYIRDKKIMSDVEFVHRSSGLTATTFGLSRRGYLKVGYYADVAVIDPETFAPKADYLDWDRLSSGVKDILVNGELAIRDHGIVTEALSGQVLKRDAGAP